MNILFIFIDGIGIGQFNPKINPCADNRIKLFNNFLNREREHELPFGGLIKSIDASLGLPGIPQSATGQTALLTGVNAAQILGRHLSGYPNQTLRELLDKESILTKMTHRGKKAAFINAYRPIFFEHGPEALIRYLSVTSIANWKAGLKFHSLEDLKAENSIYHDFTNYELLRRGYQVPIFTAEKAGLILAHASKCYDFCLYEYFKTDHAGHAQNIDHAVLLLIRLEKFILSVIAHIDLKNSLIIITSDHGNIEDLSIITHTRNPVPLIVWGKNAEHFLSQVHTIQDIANVLLNIVF